MSERLKELALQAGMIPGGYANTPEKIMTWRESFDNPGTLARFTELVITECFKAAMIESKGHMNPIDLMDAMKKKVGLK